MADDVPPLNAQIDDAGSRLKWLAPLAGAVISYVLGIGTVAAVRSSVAEAPNSVAALDSGREVRGTATGPGVTVEFYADRTVVKGGNATVRSGLASTLPATTATVTTR